MKWPVDFLKFGLLVLMVMAFSSLNGQDVNALMKQANEYYRNKQWQEAVNEYSRVIELDQQNWDAYIWRGYSYNALQKRIEAVADFNTVIDNDPQNLKAYLGRGFTFMSQKKYVPALEDYNFVLDHDPGNYSGLLGRGQVYNGKKEYDLAIYDFTRALQIDPEKPNPYQHRAFSYSGISFYDSAIADLDKAIEADPKNARLFNNRGLSHNKMGHYEQSVHDFEASISIDPNYALAYVNAISPLVRLNRFDQAKAYYDHYKAKGFVTFLQSEKYRFYQYFVKAATIHVVNEDWSKAIDCLDSAAQEYGSELLPETSRSFVDILYLQGYVLAKLGLTDDVKAIYEQSLAIDPLQPELKEALARLEQAPSRSMQSDMAGPEIKLISPNTTRSFTIEADKPLMEIVGKAKDSSGIKAILVNGKAVDRLEEDGLFVTEAELKEGADNLLIEATDKNGNISKASFTISINGQMAPAAKKVTNDAAAMASKAPKYYAILIAENEYADPSIVDLQKPVSDALELKRVLQENYTFEPGDIDTIFNASREEIMMAIARRSNSMTDKDNLLIFYAGHGLAIKDRFGNNDGYWIPSSARKGQEFTYISQADINNVIKRSSARHILVIADACFSGAFILTNTRALSEDATRDIVRQYEAPSRKVMASGSLETVPDDSMFLRYLRSKLNENKDKYVPADELFIRIKPAIMSNSRTMPQYAPILNTGDEGGQFIFIKR